MASRPAALAVFISARNNNLLLRRWLVVSGKVLCGFTLFARKAKVR